MPSDRAERTVVFVTYTMLNPHAIGVLFRAIRIAREMHRRGWHFVIINNGPLPEDPKLDALSSFGEIVRIGGPDGEQNLRETYKRITACRPALVVFGETPFPGMEPFLEGAKLVAAPLVILDQFYEPNPATDLMGIDRLILYGLASMWRDRADELRDICIVPPFIDHLTAPGELTGDEYFARGQPVVAVLGLDESVLRGGVSLLGRCQRHRPFVMTTSRDPALAATLLDAAGIGPERRVALPLLGDCDLFGWMHVSRVVVLANGFMQMMEAVALGSPAMCIDRGIGMPGWSVPERYRRYVSNGDDEATQLARLEAWLDDNPLTPEELDALAHERGGLTRCVDELEEIARRRALRPRWQRLRQRAKVAFDGTLRRTAERSNA